MSLACLPEWADGIFDRMSALVISVRDFPLRA
jgi:hypothetical protein